MNTGFTRGQTQWGTSYTGNLGSGVTVVTFPIIMDAAYSLNTSCYFAGDILNAYMVRANAFGTNGFQWDGHVIRRSGAEGTYANMWISTAESSNGATYIAIGFKW